GTDVRGTLNVPPEHCGTHRLTQRVHSVSAQSHTIVGDHNAVAVSVVEHTVGAISTANRAVVRHVLESDEEFVADVHDVLPWLVGTSKHTRDIGRIGYERVTIDNDCVTMRRPTERSFSNGCSNCSNLRTSFYLRLGSV